METIIQGVGLRHELWEAVHAVPRTGNLIPLANAILSPSETGLLLRNLNEVGIMGPKP